MSARATSLELRQLLATARKYRREGYRVTMPEPGDSLPQFLEGLMPDLVAERDDDRVIVEVKRADTVPGSNDMIALAEKIAVHPDWRFELISVPATTTVTLPDASVIGDIDRLVTLGFMEPAFLFAYAMIENIIAYVALKNDLNPANVVSAKLTRQLANLGLISGDTRDMIEKAANRRNKIAHALDRDRPTEAEVEALVQLADRLKHEVFEEEDA